MKKFTSIALIGAMTAMLALSGCAKSDSDSSDQSGDSEATFLIGGSGPLTGDAASYGESVKQGAEIAISEINEAGGVDVDGTMYQLELEFQDDEATAEKAVTAYNTLMDDGMDAFLGTVTSGAALAVKDATYQDGILSLSPSASAEAVTEYDNAFRICFTDPMQGQQMADYAYNTLGYTKMAVIYHNDDDYSQGVRDAFEEEFTSLGGEIVASEASSSADNDFSTQLTSIKKTEAQAIFAPVYYQAATYITQQSYDAGMALPFLGSDGWDGILNTVTDTAAVEGATFLSPFLASDDSVSDFVTSYEDEYGSTPDQFAADGYDGVYTIKAAMEEAGSTDSADLIAAMTEITVEGLTGTITFDENGEPNKDAKFITIKDGEYVVE